MLNSLLNRFIKGSISTSQSLLAILLAVLMVVWMSSVSAESSPAIPPPGEMINIGNHSLHLNCQGSGSPTVILESGLGGNSLDWARVLPGVSKFTRVCAYDRAGYGWSEMGPMPRTSLLIANELHRLLKTAKVEAPYVLVGHSFGGYSVRLFASHYPKETAALVLVDASHEQQFRYLRKVDRSRRAAGWEVAAAGLSIPDNLPENVRETAKQLADSNKAVRALQSETRYFQVSADQTLWHAKTVNIPVTVLSRGQRVWPHDKRGDRMEATWEWLQNDLFIRLGSLHRIATDSGHYIHLDEPEVVINSIDQLVRSFKKESGS